MNCIKVYGIRTFSYHGCLPEETKIGGNYIIDVDLWCDFSESALTDDLSKTIDYCDVNRVVEDQMATPCKLIETVAYRIVNQLKNNAKKYFNSVFIFMMFFGAFLMNCDVSFINFEMLNGI